jgi:RNA polymerase sigma-70 factor (ECF subfamily)
MIRLQEGDHAAFDSLVFKYRGPLEGFFTRNLRDRQLAEDLTQETLLKVFNRAWDYLPVGRFRGWMYRIARNLMIDSVRRRSHDALILAGKQTPRKKEDDHLARIAGEILSPDDLAGQRELADLVDRLLEKIPEEQRVTFTLHHYSELPLPEVAEIMDTSLPTCKSRLRLAREKLRDMLRTFGIGAPSSFSVQEDPT